MAYIVCISLKIRGEHGIHCMHLTYNSRGAWHTLYESHSNFEKSMAYIVCISFIIGGEYCIHCMTCFPLIISEMTPQIFYHSNYGMTLLC